MPHVETFIIVSGDFYDFGACWRISNGNLVIKLKELPIDSLISLYAAVLKLVTFSRHSCATRKCIMFWRFILYNWFLGNDVSVSYINLFDET